MHKIVSNSVLLIMMMALSGCLTFREDGKLTRFTPQALYVTTPGDDSEFTVGFRHGCNTALGIMGSGMLRFHGFEYDINRGIENQEYYRGYRAGTDACVYHVDTGSI